MGISAVLAYVKSQLDGADLSGGGDTVAAFAVPMPVLRNGVPEPLRLYIWPDRIRITQPTMSADAPHRTEDHPNLLMVLRETVNQQSAVEAFPSLVDGLISKVCNFPSRIPIDANGGVVAEGSAVSWITYIGAEFNVKFDYPRLILKQRPATLVCQVGVTVKEQIRP